MKISCLVLYDSWSQNTQCIAKEMAEKLDCSFHNLSENAEVSLEDAHLIVVGSPVHFSFPTFRVLLQLLKIPKRKKVFLFCTYGAPGFGSIASDWCLFFMKFICRAECVGQFKCKGFNKLFGTNAGHPNDADKRAAGLAAESLASLL